MRYVSLIGIAFWMVCLALGQLHRSEPYTPRREFLGKPLRAESSWPTNDDLRRWDAASRQHPATDRSR